MYKIMRGQGVIRDGHKKTKEEIVGIWGDKKNLLPDFIAIALKVDRRIQLEIEVDLIVMRYLQYPHIFDLAIMQPPKEFTQYCTVKMFNIPSISVYCKIDV